MPKVVDHEERRREIANAVLRVVAADGVAAATLRRVAKESGHAMGTIQHYFGTTAAMLQFALGLHERLRAERITSRVRRTWEHGPRAVLEGIAAEVLPVTDAQLRDTAVGVAYYVAWHRDPKLRSALVQQVPAGRSGIAAVVAEGQRQKVVDPTVDPDQEAAIYFALLDALASGIVIGYQDADEAFTTVAYHLDRLFQTSAAADRTH